MSSLSEGSPVRARVLNTLEKGIQIDLPSAAMEKYLWRNLNRKIPFVVMIVDIDHSTELIVKMPTDRIAAIIHIFSQEVSMIVSQYGGYVFNMKETQCGLLEQFCTSSERSSTPALRRRICQ